MVHDIKVLLAEDDPQMQLAVKASLSRAGYDVVVVGDGRAALNYLEQESCDLIVSDQRMPEVTGQELLAAVQKKGLNMPFIMITAYGTITQAVEAMQLGAADFITKPFSAEDLLRVVERVLSPENRNFHSSQAGAESAVRGRPIVTNDPLMIRILEVCEAVAKSDATVLVQGESGTGKELIARLIHSASPRAKQSFVAVNCAALPANLLESELFGHEKGAFTGAQNRKIGKFELAHGGTILLDEISEMDLALQAKLLRVLQEREVDRVGGREPVQIDVRVVATTNRNLEDMVNRGAFRADLYYRLNVIPITLPALRERKGDIKLLAQHFIRHFMGEKAPVLVAEVLKALEGYNWPGNVRELQNAVERAAILCRGGSPREADFLLGLNPLTGASRITAGAPVAAAAAQPQRLNSQVEKEITGGPASIQNAGNAENSSGLVIRSGLTVQEMEKTLICETLKATGNNRTEAARLIGISIRTLRNKLHEYNGGEAAEQE